MSEPIFDLVVAIGLACALIVAGSIWMWWLSKHSVHYRKPPPPGR